MYKTLLIVVCLGWCSFSWGMDRGSQVIVLANGSVPESVELARYYMSKRSIPSNHLCTLELPRGEVITREDYDQLMKAPLCSWLQQQGFVKENTANDEADADAVWQMEGIKYLVSMYGVPVAITSFSERLGDWLHNKRQQVNRAAVDSELSVLFLDVNEPGPLRNPLFAACGSEGNNEQILLCTRLDGANPQVVRSMIDGALEAEKYGLNGYAWFDARGLSRENLYYAGDHMIEEAYNRFKRAGYECYFDQQEELMKKDIPLDHAAIYMGWYEEHITGPFRRKGFRFEPGAVAYHLHSSSARRLRTSVGYWAGPFTALGAAATMGAVAEPFLQYTPCLGIFSDRLCRGYTFAESVYMAQPVVSWQITVVGDPVYSPFAATLDEQTANIRRDGKIDKLQWVMLRKVNLLLMEQLFSQAINLCSKAAEELDSNMLRERLADLYAQNGMPSEALALYERICNTAVSDSLVFRSGVKCVTLMRREKQEEKAMTLQKWLQNRLKDNFGLLRALKE